MGRAVHHPGPGAFFNAEPLRMNNIFLAF
jgi:hypothetical protein